MGDCAHCDDESAVAVDFPDGGPSVPLCATHLLKLPAVREQREGAV